jgi:hypothetical protein
MVQGPWRAPRGDGGHPARVGPVAKDQAPETADWAVEEADLDRKMG